MCKFVGASSIKLNIKIITEFMNTVNSTKFVFKKRVLTMQIWVISQLHV